MEKVKVLGWWMSPFSKRVELALKLKDVAYDYSEEDLPNKSAMLLQTVLKTVPVLVHSGDKKFIAESSVILEYIEERWPQKPILPEDLHERAMARFWAKFAQDKCSGWFWKIVWCKGDEVEKAKLVKEALENFETLEAVLNGNKFFGGEEIGMVDISANFIGYWLRVAQEVSGVVLVTEEKFPALWGWMDAFVRHDVVKQTLPPEEDVRAAFQARLHAPSWKY